MHRRRTAVPPLGKCGKPKFSSDSVFKNRTVQKFDIRSDGFPTETACKSAIYVKSDKKLLYLHSNVHIKNGLNTCDELELVWNLLCYISAVVANVLAKLLFFASRY